MAALAGGPATEQKRHIKSPAHRAGQLTLRGKPARSWPGLARLAQSLPTTSLMKAHNLTTRLKICGGCALVIAAVWLCVRLAFFATSRALRKADETVTLDSNRHTAATSPPVISSAPLPAADRDLEVIGDHIAEAIIYLNRGRRETALRALDQAQTKARRALTRRPITEKVNERLKLTLRETEQARGAIARGRLSAAALALRKLARQLDANAY